MTTPVQPPPPPPPLPPVNPALKQALFEACETKTWQDVVILLRRGASLFWEDELGLHPFHHAMMGKNFEVAERVLEHRQATGMDSSAMVDKQMPGQNQDCAIHIACREDKESLVDWILSCGGKHHKLVNGRGNLGIHEACDRGHEHVLNRLLTCEDFQVDVLSTGNHTPLHKAVLKDHIVVVRTLLKKGANVNILYPTDETVLHVAIDRKYWDIVNLLIQTQGMNVNARNVILNTALHCACLIRAEETKPVTNPQNAPPAPPLENAATGRAIKALLHARADPNTMAFDGSSPLYVACLHGDINLVRVLLAHRARVHLDSTKDSLEMATARGHSHIVDVLNNHVGW